MVTKLWVFIHSPLVLKIAPTTALMYNVQTTSVSFALAEVPLLPQSTYIHQCIGCTSPFLSIVGKVFCSLVSVSEYRNIQIQPYQLPL